MTDMDHPTLPVAEFSSMCGGIATSIPVDVGAFKLGGEIADPFGVDTGNVVTDWLAQSKLSAAGSRVIYEE